MASKTTVKPLIAAYAIAAVLTCSLIASLCAIVPFSIGQQLPVSPLSPQAAYAQEADSQDDISSGKKKMQVIAVPQRLYGVAKNAPAFKINAKSKTTLAFESSNPDIANVAPDGTVVVGDKTGMAVVNITAAETEEYRSATTKVAVRVAAYVKTNKMIAQSSQNRDGHPGDSGDNESIYCSYFDLGWGFIVRCTDPYIAD